MRLILVTGSGGAGVTTVAAATAVLAADQGRKTVVSTLDGDPSALSAALRPGEEVLRPGDTREVTAGLSLVRADPRGRLRHAWPLLRVLPAGDGRPVIAGLDADEIALLPGLAEVVALLELRDLLSAGRSDVMVLDAGPAAQALRLLAMPEALGRHLDRLLPVERRVAAALAPGGAGVPDGVLDVALELRAALGDLQRLLASASTRLVLTPDRGSLAAGRRTLTRLAAVGQRVGLVVVNRLVPADSGDPWLAAWANRQREAVGRFERQVAPTPVRAVAQALDEPVGVGVLRELALEVHGDEAADDDRGADPVSLRSDGDGFVLTVALPFVERADLQLARHDDDLVLGVGDDRRTLALPPALRRCRIDQARLVEERLEVRFVRDPALWPEGL